MHLHPGMDCAEQPEMYKVTQKNDTYCFAAKIGCRGPILLFHGCFGTRISSPIQLATLQIPFQNLKWLKNARTDTVFSSFLTQARKL